MLFLRQIRAVGFKSFAEPTTLNFTKEMIGVVGPNGSGKSNITDSIRWALGEQSTKSLRGSNMDDIVFSGSADKLAADFAEVTLVFDNQRDIFSTIKTNVVEITRRFNKKTRDSDFFINGEKCKLRDIQDIALETGLTKSSIAIISQGTISTFAEAKPDARREIFDEAAGLAKYKKRKLEALKQLAKTTENLTRINDIKTTLEKRLPREKEKAEKAAKYKDKIEKLQKIELTILASDALRFETELSSLRDKRRQLDIEVQKLANEINLSQDELDVMLSKTGDADKEITQLNLNFQKIVERIANLKTQKQQVEARENSQNVNENIDDIKARATKKEFDEKSISLNSEKALIASFEKQELDLKRRYDEVNDQFRTFHMQSQEIESEKNKLQYRLEELEHKQNTNNLNPMSGAKAIIDNAKRLSGVVGTVGSLIDVQEEHQIAISLITGNHLQSVVFKTSEDAKKGIEFLKNQRLGRVNALPIDTLNPSSIAGPQRDLIKRATGFVGFANELVEIEENCQVVLDYIYGTTIVTRNFDDATRLGKSINFRYGIVSLDGQRVLPRGAMSGGSVNKASNIFAAKKVDESFDPEAIKVKISTLDKIFVEKQKTFNDLKEVREKLIDDINQIASNIRIGKNSINIFDSSLVELSDNYKIITGKDLLNNQTSSSFDESESIRLAREIAKLETERNEISIKVSGLSDSKTKTTDRQHELNKENKEKREILNNWKDELANVKSDLNILESTNIQILKRLSEGYNLSLDAVREMHFDEIENPEETRLRIQELTIELKSIGKVSMDAIQEYEEAKKEFDYYVANLNEVQESADKLNEIILNIDIEMKTQFKRIVDDVNAALPEAFQKLFNGGTASLIYTNPDDILETGIDIEVNPPGKKITNLNLLSGGEKSLVALSVLFSILKVRPLPLVILDEAEAPLDPANVTRFARYVRDFVENTQFIIVTHREGTMENCDILYGVTMETKGITKIVQLALDIDKIKQLVNKNKK